MLVMIVQDINVLERRQKYIITLQFIYGISNIFHLHFSLYVCTPSFFFSSYFILFFILCTYSLMHLQCFYHYHHHYLPCMFIHTYVCMSRYKCIIYHSYLFIIAYHYFITVYHCISMYIDVSYVMCIV